MLLLLKVLMGKLPVLVTAQVPRPGTHSVKMPLAWCQHVRIAVLPSHRYGDVTSWAILSVMHAVC
jgi:hypothetical protein